MNYQIDYRSFSGIFAVPNQVKNLLGSCSGTMLKVLLLILSQPQEPINPSHLSAALGYPPADIEEALDFWCKQGILSGKNSFSAESVEQTALTPLPRVRRVTNRKALTNQEMEMLAANDPNIPLLLQEAQNIWGDLLTSSMQETLCSFYTYDKLPVEYLLLVLMYCVQRDKKSFGYLRTLVNAMLEKGVDDYDKAETYLNNLEQSESHEGIIRSAFGIHDRVLTTKEKTFISDWFNQFGFDISVIKLAYERTIDNIGKPSFPYTNRILSDWHAKDIKTAKEAAAETVSQKKNNGSKGGLASSIDHEELEKLSGKLPF